MADLEEVETDRYYLQSILCLLFCIRILIYLICLRIFLYLLYIPFVIYSLITSYGLCIDKRHLVAQQQHE